MYTQQTYTYTYIHVYTYMYMYYVDRVRSELFTGIIANTPLAISTLNLSNYHTMMDSVYILYMYICTYIMCVTVQRIRHIQSTYIYSVTMGHIVITYLWDTSKAGLSIKISLTGQVHDGSTGETIGADLPQYFECSDHTARLPCLQEVDEEIEPPRVPDGQLTGLLFEVKLHESTEGNDCGCLVASLQVLDQLLDLPVLTW